MSPDSAEEGLMIVYSFKSEYLYIHLPFFPSPHDPQRTKQRHTCLIYLNNGQLSTFPASHLGYAGNTRNGGEGG